MHPSALSVVALQPPGPPVQPDGEEVPPAALPPALLQAAAVAHLAALPAPAGHHSTVGRLQERYLARRGGKGPISLPS